MQCTNIMDIQRIISKRIKDLRIQKGLSQSEVAEILSVDTSV